MSSPHDALGHTLDGAFETVRVRFAPSPTGYLHVGGLRTALYNYLFARRHGGVFILRIEDTDRTRLVEGAVEQLVESLAWSGLDFDEGPGKGGPHGPYVQSERLDLYREAIARLRDRGHAYPCFCTPERLEQMRAEQKAAKGPMRYDRACLALDPAEVAARERDGVTHVIRLEVPRDETLTVDDLVRGSVRFDSNLVDDQVLLKSDGFPTYHLANVVDDSDMRVSHVIRGEEWLSSMPKHLLLYRFLDKPLPRFAHLPLLLNPDRSKLSKRQGDVSVEDYRDKGYFPEALLNFVAFLGWNPGDDREIFQRDELEREFSLDRVTKSGAIFNLDKLRWFNSEYLKRRPVAETVREVTPLLREAGFEADEAYVTRVVDLMKERLTFVHDFPRDAAFFFRDPEHYDEDTVRKRWKANSAELLRKFLPALQSLQNFDHESVEAALQSFAAEEGAKPGEVIHPLRLATSGVGKGPSLYDMLEALGRDRVVRRVETAIERIPVPA